MDLKSGGCESLTKGWSAMCDFGISCADQEGAGILSPLENRKNIGFLSNICPDPPKTPKKTLSKMDPL